jgi:hypothetical protein
MMYIKSIMRVITTLLAIGLGTSLCCARQETVKAAPQTLDQLASNLLMFPQVQAELRLTEEQTGKLIIRQVAKPVRVSTKAICSFIKSSSESDPLQKALSEAIPDGILSSFPLQPSDLKDRQKTRLRELAVQTMLVESLRTDEMQKLLQLTEDQKAKLAPYFKYIDDEEEATSNEEIDKKIEDYWTRIEDLGSTLEKAKANVTEIENVSEEMLTYMEKTFMKVYLDSITLYIRYSQKTDEEIRKILTKEQQKKLKVYSGQPFRIGIF